jgi:ATPase subunit of ABC transporter with duplicated ATPase domains
VSNDRVIVTDLAAVTRAHGDRTIFADLSWTIESGARIGLIGPNGSGKTTLLRTIAGLEPPEGGLVTRPRDVRISYLAQEQEGTAASALSTLLRARPDIAAVDRDLAVVGQQLADPAVAADMARLEEALERQERLLHSFERAGGPRLRNRAEGLLRELGIPAATGSCRWGLCPADSASSSGSPRASSRTPISSSWMSRTTTWTSSARRRSNG